MYSGCGITVVILFDSSSISCPFLPKRFTQLFNEKEAKKATKQKKADARKEQKQRQRDDKLREYGELRSTISKQPKNKKYKLTNKLFNVLWFGILDENPGAEHAFSELSKTKEIGNHVVLTTPDILDLIGECDKQFLGDINARCCWQARICAEDE